MSNHLCAVAINVHATVDACYYLFPCTTAQVCMTNNRIKGQRKESKDNESSIIIRLHSLATAQLEDSKPSERFFLK